MWKRTQEDAGEERVTANSKPMMNLVSRYSVRDPNVIASTASESPGKTKSESQNVPLSSLKEQQTRTGRPVVGASSSNYSEWNIDDEWCSQEWKSGGQGDGVPKACQKQAAADSQGSRTCVCANTSPLGWHMQGRKDKLTSCRGTVQSAWQKPPVRRKGGRAGLPKKGKWPPRGTGNRQSSPILEVRPGNRQGW